MGASRLWFDVFETCRNSPEYALGIYLQSSFTLMTVKHEKKYSHLMSKCFSITGYNYTII